jgi:hypothetical protein
MNGEDEDRIQKSEDRRQKTEDQRSETRASENSRNIGMMEEPEVRDQNVRVLEISKRTAGMMEGWQEEDRIPQLNRFHIQRGKQKSEDSRRATQEEGNR